MTSFNDNNTEVNQNCNYSVSNRVRNSNTKMCHFFDHTVAFTNAQNENCLNPLKHVSLKDKNVSNGRNTAMKHCFVFFLCVFNTPFY